MAIYMQVDDIEGDVTQENHLGWVALQDLKLPTERPDVNTAPGKVRDRTTSSVDFKDVEVTKMMDKASPNLMMWNIKGSTRKVTIHVCKEQGNVVLELILYNSILTIYESSCDEFGAVEESISFDYTKIEYNYTPYNDQNEAGTPAKVEYDLETAG